MHAALLQRAMSWGRGRAELQAWQWMPTVLRPAPCWKEEFDAEGAVVVKPSIDTRAALCSDRRQTEENQKRLDHNANAELGKKHVIAPWPTVDPALGLTGRDKEYAMNKSRISCEKCPVTVSYAVRWRAFAVQQCKGWD